MEAEDQLLILEEGLLRLEHLSDPQVVRRMFTAAHTIKGSAAMLGLQDIATLTHELEDVLDQLRKNPRTIEQQQAGVLLQVVDEVRALCAEVLNPQPRPESLQVWLERLKHWERPVTGPQPVSPSSQPEDSPAPALGETAGVQVPLPPVVLYDVSMTARMQQAWVLLEAGFQVRYTHSLQEISGEQGLPVVVVGVGQEEATWNDLQNLPDPLQERLVLSHPPDLTLPDWLAAAGIPTVPLTPLETPQNSLLVQRVLQRAGRTL